MVSRLIVVLLGLLCGAGVLAQAPLVGKVVSVADGDTLTVLVQGNRQVKVRLAQVDAPERGQPHGTRSRQALAELAFQATVTVQVKEIDRYGRTVGTVFVDGRDVNAELVRRGAAWVYARYATDPALYELQSQAQRDGRGLWSLPEAQRVPPWQWRRERRGASSAIDTPPAEDRRCGSKRYCRQMSSCDEARFHLEQCGVSSLDGDGDGVPCEAICS